MPRYQIIIDQPSTLPLADLFNAMADHNNMSKLFGAPVKRIRDGQGEVNGLGSVRQIGPGPVAVHETITAFEPHRRIEYRVSKGGAPMKNHRGEIRFASTEKGSRLHWQIDFDMPPLIGSIVKSVLEGVLARGVRKLA
jgi:hypothetical protein